MSLPKLGCAYPRCPAPDSAKFKTVAGRISECESCGRLMAACTSKSCQGAGTFNRPFVLHCRRCGQKSIQAADWERARCDGWNLAPKSVSPPEVIADLSRLADTNSAGHISIATAMIHGTFAVHQAGHYLALLKAVPGASGESVLWEFDNDPFPTAPDGSFPAPYRPMLLPGERYLVYSSRQGFLVLDLWSCQGLSAKDANPRFRLITCKRRWLARAPVALDEHRIGLLLKGRSRTDEAPFRWAVWDLRTPRDSDFAFAARLDSEDLTRLPLMGRNCQCDLVENQVVTFSTPREHWAWRISDAGDSAVDALAKTWPSAQANASESVILEDQIRIPRQAFLSHGRSAERFSWFMCVRDDDPSNPESVVKRYEVNFESLKTTFPQIIKLPPGATPIGSALNRDGIPQMYFRTGTEIWSETDGQGTNHEMDGLPRSIKSLHLDGPLVVSVGERNQGERSIQVDSLQHRGGHANVLIERTLLSDPVLWYRWLYTVELDDEDRLQAIRRTVVFDDPQHKN